MPQKDPIEHVVVLMMENHSFDQLLGWTKTLYPTLEGVDSVPLQANPDYPTSKPPVAQGPTTETALSLDPRHDTPDVLSQIDDNCKGFVSDFAHAYPQSSPDQRKQIMAYYPKGTLPVIHTLAEQFLICDHWFSSLPGPTWPNRFFVHTGTCKGHIRMPTCAYLKGEHLNDQNTIFDELDHKGKHDWSVYHHGLAHTMTLTHLWDKPERFHRMEKFFEHAQGDPKKFPRYAFIEPCYAGRDQNDQHPPTDIRAGEHLIARVYNALRSNEPLWNSTLFILLYDEHGGFYDHVIPPKAVPPDDHLAEYSFDQYGVRVPALLISPWVKKGFVNTVFDHTSLLKYLIEKWDLQRGQLGKRVETAASFSSALLELETARPDVPDAFDLPSLPQAPEPTCTNELQGAFLSFSHVLEQKMAPVEELSAIGYRALKSLDGAVAQMDMARDRFLLFLHHAKQGRLTLKNNSAEGQHQTMTN